MAEEIAVVAGRLLPAWRLARGASRAASYDRSLAPVAGEFSGVESGFNWRLAARAAAVGAVSGGALGAASIGFKRALDTDYPKMSSGHATDTQMGGIVDVAGDLGQINRTRAKRVLKSGTLRGKLKHLHEDFIQRWQRIYPFGTNSVAYPTSGGETEAYNPGVSNSTSWPTAPVLHSVGLRQNGRLVLSHVHGLDSNFQFMPGYVMDLTCWNNATDTYKPVPMKRIAIDNNGDFRWVPVAQIYDDPQFDTSTFEWGVESGTTGTGNPNSTEDHAMLTWNQVKLGFYGSKFHCTRIIVEMIQVKDPKIMFNFHSDGEAISAMTDLDKYNINQFWNNEFKSLTFNPMFVQSESRKQYIKLLYRDEFCINSDSNTDQSVDNPYVERVIFKRLNRLCNFKWNKKAPNYSNAWVGLNEGGMENPQFFKTDQGQLLPFLHPKARIYLYIRADHFSPIGQEISLASAPNRESSFDIIVRNKWMVQQ